MSMIWIGVLVLAAPPSGAPGLTAATASAATPAISSSVSASRGAQAASPQAPLRSGRKLADAVHAALQRWAHANGKNAGAAAQDFLVLYRELRADKRLAVEERDELRGLVRGRLLRLSKMIAAAARHAPSAQQQPGAVAKVGQPAAVLAQVAPAGGGGGAAMPGPGGAGGPDDDYGPSLVELIQTTIAPDTWDVNGGLGSIYYWRNQHALVIRATDDVHGFIGELMEQMDAAGH
jgi:hypothetical protein